MKKIVAYFSATGITAKVAARLAEAIGADVSEIQPERVYSPMDLNWRDGNSRSSLEMKDPASRPRLAKRDRQLEDFDVLYIGFPIWWYVAPRIVNTFLESYDLTGKIVVPFATSGGSGVEKVNESLRPSCAGARLMEPKLLKEDSTLQELSQWAEEEAKNF